MGGRHAEILAGRGGVQALRERPGGAGTVIYPACRARRTRRWAVPPGRPDWAVSHACTAWSGRLEIVLDLGDLLAEAVGGEGGRPRRRHLTLGPYEPKFTTLSNREYEGELLPEPPDGARFGQPTWPSAPHANRHSVAPTSGSAGPRSLVWLLAGPAGRRVVKSANTRNPSVTGGRTAPVAALHMKDPAWILRRSRRLHLRTGPMGRFRVPANQRPGPAQRSPCGWSQQVADDRAFH